MSDRSRKTSDIVKHVDEVEETIPDFYGPQNSEPVEEVKKGDTWFVTEQQRVVVEGQPVIRMRPLEIRNYSQPLKVIKLH